MAAGPAPGTYEVNTTYLQANVRAIRDLKFYDLWHAQLSADAKQLVDDLHTRSWWPGALNEELLRVLGAACGDAAVEAVGYQTVQRSIGPIVMPLLKIMLTITGSDPHTIFSRLGQFSTTSSRGVDIGWNKIDATHGETVLQYPARADPVMKHLWRGGLRMGFKLLDREGDVESATQSLDGKTLTFRLGWK